MTGASLVTIHQPEHLPWLGFFAKMAAADVLIALDSVPFRKNYFQNRNRVLGRGGAAAWLTVPVRLQGHTGGRIADVEIAGDAANARWREKYVRTLRQRYGGAPCIQPLFDEIEAIVRTPCERIADLNLSIIRLLARHLHIATPIVRATELGCAGARSGLLAALAQRLGARTYLAGPSSRDYLDLAPFAAAGIEVLVHDYEHPVYPQGHGGPFVAQLSAVDALFNLGREAVPLLRAGSRVSRLARNSVAAA